MKSTLYNFLGTYTSRYSDYDGYWLFGLIVGDLQQLSIDLLHPDSGSQERTPKAVAVSLATIKFREQAVKAGVPLESVRDATLVIRKDPETKRSFVDYAERVGYNVLFSVQAIMASGRVYQAETSVFVVPHDSRWERRRLPEDWGASREELWRRSKADNVSGSTA